ncbi:class I SAM-dependent methyltransferase [Aceticella autotrophica]|uniref:Class I SAM-dependent methyltransferase n=1 Tax=Aceticella autotrophica TaxID=2755338 RepID=A0A975AXA1_9THEO|nr:class I SAM-dependent methyltransferase [Aceticella autotrophica]QSZ28187.1 class I SAM-dependent methyltransferase [Aceticella autotrophica]
MESLNKRLCEVDFWQNVWEDAKNSSFNMRKKIRTEKEDIEFWNKFAPSYGKNTSGRGKERLEKVIRLLESEGILSPEAEILDIGCGPGTYAIPFAKRVKSVTAVDGAEEMCRILKENMEKSGLKNINILNRLWGDVDIKKEGLENGFDLVFASMTPAVSDYKALMKMNEASRKYCCLISWAGARFNPARNELWKIIFHEEDKGMANMIIYPFNLLYSLGYYPTMQYLNTGWMQEETIDEAVESLSRTFWRFTEITPEIKDIIYNYVKEKAKDGLFRQETKVRMGIMTWRVDEGGKI